jgi:transposase InsO family protein
MSAPTARWIDRDTLRKASGWSARHIQRLAKTAKLRSRRSENKSRRGRLEREYLLQSLPAEIQIKVMRLDASAPAEEAMLLRGAAGLPTQPSGADNNGARPNDAGTDVRILTPEQEAAAKEVMKWVALMIDFREGRAVRLADGREPRTETELAEYIASQQKPPVASRTIWRWVNAFDEEGFNGLASKPSKFAGKSRYFASHPKAAAFVEVKYLSEGIQNVRLVHDALVREWRNLGEEGDPPTYDTVSRYLAKIPLPVRTLAHEGKQALWAKRSPFILRHAPPAMDCWISDHREFDVLVRNTLFPHMPRDQQYRLWLTAVYDWGSRALVGYCFSPSPCSDTINSALRMALSKYGFPRGFYWDNGKDYKSVGRKLDEITISNGLRRMLQGHAIEFGVTSALPKRPRSKTIEAYFTRWSRRFDVLRRKGYLGNRPGNCPEVTRDAQKQHRKYLDGKRAESPLATDREFIIAADQWIFEYNDETCFTSLDGKTPWEVLDEQCPPEQRQAVPRRALDALLLKDDPRTVLAGGCVEIQRMRYEPRPEFLGALYLCQGRKVQILRDPFDLTIAVAVDAETYEFIGELMLQIPVGHAPGDPQTQEQVKSRMRNERALGKACRNYIEALTAGASAFGWKTEWQGLLDRAQLRTGTDNAALAAAPGARRAKELPAAPRPVAPAFVSDAVKQDADIFAHVEVMDSPFVDDAAAKFIKAMEEKD